MVLTWGKSSSHFNNGLYIVNLVPIFMLKLVLASIITSFSNPWCSSIAIPPLVPRDLQTHLYVPKWGETLGKHMLIAQNNQEMRRKWMHYVSIHVLRY